MSKTSTIKAETRTRSGSGVLKKLRREGLLPSVIYGKDFENINLKIEAKAFRDILAHSSSDSIVVNLEIDGKDSRMAFLKDVQYDAISGTALHADFRAIDAKTTITANIPANLIGTAPGVKEGGVVEHYVQTLEISCLPGNLPDSIDIDISELAMGDSVLMGDIKFPEGVSHAANDDVVIVHIGKPAAAISEESAEGEAAAPAEGEAAAEGAAEGGEEAKAEETPAEG